MSKPYSLSEDEFDTLRRAHESIQLLSILLEEVRQATTFTPQMIASFLELACEDLSSVLLSRV